MDVVSDDVSDDISDDVCDDISDDVSDDISDGVSDDVCDDISDPCFILILLLEDIELCVKNGINRYCVGVREMKVEVRIV